MENKLNGNMNDDVKGNTGFRDVEEKKCSIYIRALEGYI